MEKLDAITLLLDSNRGQFIPRDFVNEFKLEKFGFVEDQIELYKEEMQEPSHEYYWDNWNSILMNACYKQDENEFYLYQNGDLWLVCPELMNDEEKENFGFNE